GVAPPHQHEQACHQRRVDGQVEPVARRREGNVVVEQLRVAVRVDVAGEEEELAAREQEPRHPGARLVHEDPGDDRQRGRQPEKVDERAVPFEMGREQVRDREDRADREVGHPDLGEGCARARENGHAARSSAWLGWRSKLLTSSPMTATSWSISDCVLAAVTWMRKPTSLLGTSGYAASVT